MADQLEMRFDADPDWALVQLAIGEHASREIPRHEKMWAYFRNPLELVGVSGTAGGKGWYRAAQEIGLPERIRGNGSGVYGDQRGRREVVIENDIGWRVQTMVDFMFGDPIRFESTAGDAGVKLAVESVLEAVWEASGGIALLQDLAILGHVFGHVDLLVRIDAEGLGGATLAGASEWITIEPIDARRGVALVSADDYRVLDGYAVHFERELNEVEGSRGRGGRVGRLFGGRGGSGGSRVERRQGTVTEVFGRSGWRRFENGEEVARSASTLLGGEVPVVHIQNMRQPFVYGGIGEVEPLVALQDELNTRLSDRANRVTLQSFQMYLAKGIEGFNGAGVGPGVVWSTENPDASIERFGGDMHSPSEESHITEIREAMDKVSGVPPLAGGVVRAKLGNLSSGNALRVTLMGLIAKTRRKRVGYGRGMEKVCGMILTALDAAGVLSTDPSERGVRVVWPEFAVADERETVAAAKGKIELGVPAETVIAELGYGRVDPGVV
ncbi:MAG: phage portal protein [Phycisphaerales bacterium]|nr:phage portal protein [Phycisphaerales bacterium]